MKLDRFVTLFTLCGFVLGLAAAAGCSQPTVVLTASELAPRALDFERHEITIGSAARPTVLTGFLRGGDVAEIVVVKGDARRDRLLRLYGFDAGSWTPLLETSLRPDVRFVDVARIGGRDRLLTHAHGRLSWFDPEAASEHELAAVSSSFIPPRANEIPHVDITHDLNRDGRDDLVVPDGDGFWIFVQASDGSFADPVKVGRTADMSRIYGADGYRYDPWSQSRVHAIDHDHDGRVDLVYWSGDHFVVHAQNENGLFASDGKPFTANVTFDSDDISSLATGSMEGRILHSIVDVNGDGIGDLVVLSLKGKRISRKQSSFEVHLGARTHDGRTAFARGASAVFRSEGVLQLDMAPYDLDRDGKTELMFTTIKRKLLKSSPWKRLKGFMGDSVGLSLAFYKAQDGLFGSKPNAIHGIDLQGSPTHRSPGWVPAEVVLLGGTHERKKKTGTWARAFNQNVLLGDVTGDGRCDLLMEATFRSLNLFVGVPGPDLFARRPQNVPVILPNDTEYTWLVDMDRDGRKDILMHHPCTLRDVHGAPKMPPGSEPHRVTILFAR